MYHRNHHPHREDSSVQWLLASVFVVFVIISGVLLQKRSGTSFNQNPNLSLLSYEVGNISENSLAIFWRTSSGAPSLVQMGTSPTNLNNRVEDVFMTHDKQNPQSTNHYIELKNLRPHTKYYFQFKSGNKVIGDKQEVYEIKTSSHSTKDSSLEPIYASVSKAKQDAIRNGVAVLKNNRISPLITQIKKDGTFLFSLCCSTNSKGDHVELTDKDNLEITIYDSDGNILKIKDTVEALIAQTTRFTLKSSSSVDGQGKEVLKIADIMPSPLPTFPLVEVSTKPDDVVMADTELSNALDIWYPLSEASLPNGSPLIKGIGPKGSILQLDIHSDKKKKGKPELAQFVRVRTDDRGIWTYAPDNPFLPGSYEVRVSESLADISSLSVKRAFTILKSGEAV
ncbi:MAG: fibronectin type III domain-containing protein, partial [Candidatus Roizmanbacteria bacterium]